MIWLLPGTLPPSLAINKLPLFLRLPVCALVELIDVGGGGGRSQTIDGEKAWSSMKSFNTLCVSPFTQIYVPTPKRMLLIARVEELGGGCCSR